MDNFIHEFPQSNLHEQNLDWTISKVKELTIEWINTKGEWTDTKEEWYALKEFVTNYFNNLDVQDEINNKLDTMATDGTLSAVIYQALGGVSFPIFVDSTDDMLNPSRIYVLTTNGEIYYYAGAGTGFVSSGLIYGEGDGAVTSFNKIISTLTIETLDFDSADDVPKNHIYAYFGSTTEYFYDLPVHNFSGILIDFAYSQGSNSGRLQIFANRWQAWFRINWGNTWFSWYSVAPASRILLTHDNAASYPDIRTLPTNNVYAIAANVTSEDVANLPIYGVSGALYKVNFDSDNTTSVNSEILMHVSARGMYVQLHFRDVYLPWVKLNSMYSYLIGGENNYYGFSSFDDFDEGTFEIYDTSSALTNAPCDAPIGMLISHAFGTSGGLQIMYYHTSSVHRTYIRYKWGGTWSVWFNMANNGYNILNNNVIDTIHFPHDVNEWLDNGTYAIGSSVTKAGIANLPMYGKSAQLIVNNYGYTANNCIMQMFITLNNDVWFRVKYSTIWSDWVGLTETGMNYFINTCIEKPFNLTSESKVIAFGDSITSGYGEVSRSETWINLLSSRIGFTLNNVAVGGAMFKETAEKSIAAQYEAIADWTGITHVFIAAGVNDASHSTDFDDFKTYVQNTIDYIKLHAPSDVKICFITPIERNSVVYHTINYASIIASIALNNDCSIINGYDIPIPFINSEWFDNLTQDGLHPTEQGQKVYANFVATQIL